VRRRDQWRAAENEAVTAEVRELPMFPLSLVSFPGCMTPLFIFEAKYRMMFNTLLAGESDVDQELVQKDSPFEGTREFGMCFVGRNGMENVGTMLRIEKHERRENGQMVVVNKGVERFKVLQELRKQPYMVCQVEMLPDIPDDVPSTEMQELSEEVSETFRNVVRLSRKVNQRELEAYTEPVELKDMNPTELSFWFASLLAQSQPEQQNILEERSCRARLLRVKQIFGDALKFLSAASALDSAFQSDA